MNKNIREWGEAVLFASAICIVLYFICFPFKVDGNSMAPSLLDRDRIVISRLTTYFGTIDRGDIIVTAANINDDKVTIVKRVIGIPGDNITLKENKVYLNGDVLKEPYLGNTNITEGSIDVLLLKDQYFILGDNRDVSLDSRKLGPVSGDDVKGKVIAKWYPIKSFEIY